MKKVYVQAMPNSVCCQKMSINFMSAAPTAKWCHSLPLPLHIAYGSHDWNAVRLPSAGDSGAARNQSGDAMALINLASKLSAALAMTGRVCRIRTLIGKPGSRSGSNFLCGCFPCLAALYESWSIPVSAMLVVPLGIVGVLLAATLFNQKMTSTLWWAC